MGAKEHDTLRVPINHVASSDQRVARALTYEKVLARNAIGTLPEL
jgi:hypothetical protein